MPSQGPPRDVTSGPLAVALRKFAKTSACPKYLKVAITAWLAAHPGI